MSGIQAGRLFRRATKLQSTLVSAHRQLHSTPARAIEKGPYNISKLVLDLDATDNESVRSLDSIVDSFRTPLKRKGRLRYRMKKMLRPPNFDTLMWNCDTPNWNFDTKSGSEAAQSDLSRCRTLTELRVFLNRVTQTADGCRWLVSNASSVKMLDYPYPITVINNNDNNNDNTTGISPYAVVWFDEIICRNLMNRAIKNIEAHGIEMGPYLCAAALSLSLKNTAIANDPSYARHYLDIMTFRLYWESLMGGELDPKNYLNHFVNSMRTYQCSGKDIPEMLTLLTGWHVGGIPAPSEQQQPCLRNFVRNVTGYAKYLQAIGDLRSSSGLWHEWDNHSVPSPALYFSAVERAALFTEAFLRANDSSSAMTVLKQTALVVTADGGLPTIVSLVRELINSRETLFVSPQYKRFVDNFLRIARRPGILTDEKFEHMVQTIRQNHGLDFIPLSMPIASD